MSHGHSYQKVWLVFFFEPSLSTFYEDHDKECALIKQKQLPEVFCEKKCS